MCSGNCGGCNDCGGIQSSLRRGQPGQSAYQIWLSAGNTGTVADFLTSLEGEDGDDGQNAYDIAVLNGFVGTQAEWLASLEGDDGDDGINAFSLSAAPFSMPGPDSVGTFQGATTLEWAGVGQPVYLEGLGTLRVASPPAGNFVQLQNPESVWGLDAPIAGNALPGVIAPFGSKLSPGGRPGSGADGDDGPPGDAPVIVVAYAIPVDPPVAPERRFVFVANAAPPARATSFVPYEWNTTTLAWVAGPEIAGIPGTQTFFQSSDPNTTPPAGAIVGDIVFRYAGATFTAYKKTSALVWTPFGAVPWPGSVTQTVVIAAPGEYGIPLEYFSYHLQTDKDIELNWDDTNYGDQGVWTVVITNTDGASNIDISFTPGRWQKGPDTALLGALPIVVHAGTRVMLTFRKNVGSGQYVFDNVFVPASL